MLRRPAIAILLFCLSVAIGLGVRVLPATAAGGPVSCHEGQTWSPIKGKCVIRVSIPGKPTVPGIRNALARPSKQGSSKPQKCVSKYTQEQMPCEDGRSRWSNDQGCYVSLADPQPPKTDPVWEGHSDGAIYECYSPDLVGTRLTVQWAPTAPIGAVAPPDPRVLAQRAVAAMELRAIRIGIVPEARPGSVGVIGLPTWMWVDEPSRNTWGPITRSASAGGFRVSATARVSRVVWAMGDGSTVVCFGRGTRYEDVFGRRSSPDCGHTYTRQGTYTVRATSYWVVDWAGIGQTGTIPLAFSESTVITMGEVQVLTQ